MFILTQQRKTDVNRAFDVYREYLDENREGFPTSVFELATSDWYYDPTRSECPHDAWLERITISEPSTGERNEKRGVEIVIELLGAQHDGKILFRYRDVRMYTKSGPSVPSGHGDWLYDEFRIGSSGSVIHEIEWVNAHWLIEAGNVEFSWHPVR